MFVGVGLLFLATLSVGRCSSYRSYSKNIDLKPGDEVVIESVNYPAHAPPNLRQSWVLKTKPGAFIQLSCNNIRLLKDIPCRNDAFVVSEKNKEVDVICGARFDYVYESTEHLLAIGLRIGPKGLGMVQCTASAQWRVHAPQKETTSDNPYAFLDFDSEELDSSEHGGPRGRKKTTCNCGWANKKVGRIFGGEETFVHEFPFVAGLLQTGSRKTFCGATIITPYHLITAAHCLYNKTQYGPFSIVVGEHDVESKYDTNVTEYIRIKKYFIHEQYEPRTHLNDIALLLLKRKITFSKWVGPACLSNGPIDLENEFIKIIGWGRTPSKPYGSPVLQKVNLKVLTKSACAALRPNSIPTGSPNQICTYGKGKSACSGDSGGPLVWIDPETNRYILAGVVSFGKRDCSRPFPRVATDATTYLEWIHKKIEETGPNINTCKKA